MGVTPDEFEARMLKVKEDFGGDPESAHARADDLLLECLRSLGYGNGCDAFDSIEMWYA